VLGADRRLPNPISVVSVPQVVSRDGSASFVGIAWEASNRPLSEQSRKASNTLPHKWKTGAPGKTRTSNPQIRSLMHRLNFPHGVRSSSLAVIRPQTGASAESALSGVLSNS
jgi:hypothetical protein